MAFACSVVIAGSLAAAAASAATGAAERGASGEAAAACERAARQSLSAQDPRPTELTFTAAPVVETSLSNERQLVLRGAGRWRGSSGGVRSFSYSCNVDARTADVVGMVMRASTPPAPAAAPARSRTAEPDLSQLSPEACESSAAEALKRRWPRVSQITFEPNMRTLRQESDSRAELRGRGRALPAPGAPSTLFGFDCAVDPRDGRVLGTRISG